MKVYTVKNLRESIQRHKNVFIHVTRTEKYKQLRLCLAMYLVVFKQHFIYLAY